MQAKFGQILCSAPTHVAVDNFASRLDQITRSIAEEYNKGKKADDLSRLRHRFVLRVFSPSNELNALCGLLEKPDAIDAAGKTGYWSAESRWKLPLSLAYWLLVLFRSKAVPPLHPDASLALHKLQKEYDDNASFSNLRDVATGNISWADFKKVQPDGVTICTGLMDDIMNKADLLCTTPSNTAREPVKAWKKRFASGVAVDEAGNMNQADLYGVWGNTLLPCFLFGDPRQLPPTVMTTNEKGAEGNVLNRFAADGGVSPLAFFVATGIPVYRLKTQLRMADGMFDMISKIIYADVPFKYGPGAKVDLPAHKEGRAIEAFFRGKFSELSPAPAGKLLPIFVHCQGSRVFTDPRTLSKMSKDQVKIALDLLVEAVKANKVDVSRVVCIAPYAANVGLIEKMRKGRQYEALQGMQPASTVDSFQGQENDVAVVIMGTAHPKPGPGFTCNPKRLNVMLSRQKSALVIVGDINVASKQARYEVIDESTGEKHVVVGRAINDVYNELRSSKRVVTVVVPGAQTAAGGGDGKDKAKDKGKGKEPAA